MRIYIPTLFRNKTQITLGRLPKALHKDVVLVLDKEDSQKDFSALQLPMTSVVCPLRGIGKVRQWIVDNHNVKKFGPNILMLDDDLRFFVRRKDDSSKFLPASDKDIIECMATLEDLMKPGGYAHAGILAREGGNRVKSKLKENTRLLRALAYNVPTLKKVGARFDVMSVMEDFHVALTMIEAGYPNVAICNFVQDQTRSNAPGGCSTYRDLVLQDQGARGLAALHPGFVTIRRVKTLTAWDGRERTDVKVAWKKAFASSQK